MPNLLRGIPQNGEPPSDPVAEGDNRLAPLRDRERGCAHRLGRGGHDSHSSKPVASKHRERESRLHNTMGGRAGQRPEGRPLCPAERKKERESRLQEHWTEA